MCPTNGVHPSRACPVSSAAFLIYTAITTAGQICSVRLSMDTCMQSHHRSHLQCYPVARWLDSHAENHGCIWKKAGPLPQNIGHAVNRILTRPRGSPSMTDDETCQWAEISQDTTETLEPNLSAAFYKAGFIPQPGHPGGTLALSQDFPPISAIPAPRPDCSWGYTKEAFTSYQELGRNNKYSSVKDKDTRLQRDTILPGFIWEFKSQAAQGSSTWLSTKPSEPVQPV
jgi:hypothetical protein